LGQDNVGAGFAYIVIVDKQTCKNRWISPMMVLPKRIINGPTPEHDQHQPKTPAADP
jgi:hypothetical protein